MKQAHMMLHTLTERNLKIFLHKSIQQNTSSKKNRFSLKENYFPKKKLFCAQNIFFKVKGLRFAT